MSNRISSTLCMALLSTILWGCGVEVGNPSEPTPTQPKRDYEPALPDGIPTVPIESINPVEPVEPVKIEVRYLVENQYDEAITAALDFAFDNSMALVAGETTRTCGVQADGSLALSHQETNSETRTSGDGDDATLVTESFSRVFASRMASEGKTLACNTSLTKPRIDWTRIDDVVVAGTLERTNSRLIVADPSQTLVRESSVKSIGSHQSTIDKVKFDPTVGLSLKRSLVFGTDMEINNRSASAAPMQLMSRIETLAEFPLVVEEAYSPESRLKSLKIASGAVSARKLEDGLMVIMRYTDVVLDAQGTCRPISGSIKGEIYSASDPTQIYETFKIGFSEKQNLIVYADGTGSKLEFEPCRIEIDKNGSGQNGPGSGPRR